MIHTRLLKRALTGTAILAATAVLAGCSTSLIASQDTTTESSLLAAHDLDGLDAKQIIDRLDTTPIADRAEDFQASIRPDSLVLSDANHGEMTVPMPDDEFYISVAPYVDQTHECVYHSPTGCKGELQNADVHVTVTDSTTGAVLYDERTVTYDNGFVGLWLPRDFEGVLAIEGSGRKGQVSIRTVGDDQPTCITTLQLT
ncbi:CueP family metal-binding protein [Leucobacter sp. HNU]|uniref:CueP family metal-binding protein n=1 Tax=Leucobacter sp. HNU TaxID=3236805 RepID=UPI003A812685